MIFLGKLCQGHRAADTRICMWPSCIAVYVSVCSLYIDAFVDYFFVRSCCVCSMLGWGHLQSLLA